MKIIDMHIHLGYDKPTEDIIKRMEKSGVWGGCVFSSPPKEMKEQFDKNIYERICEVMEFTSSHRDRLFPVLWIHPDEENVIDGIEKAVAEGIDGFKIICNDFYVYEEKCINILRKIAELGKPVFFHSGILWDGNISSSFNRPLNWEALLRIKGLRFSMGHCSWPWYDECIALYGKFLNALETGETAEMFLDLTPGTPLIYREDLLNKLFLTGYDVSGNLMFGTDCNGENYQSEWAEKWLKVDKEIMDKIGVEQNVRENIYFNNVMYFLGKEKREKNYRVPTPDNM